MTGQLGPAIQHASGSLRRYERSHAAQRQPGGRSVAPSELAREEGSAFSETSDARAMHKTQFDSSVAPFPSYKGVRRYAGC
jgi:hypothetical protein